jgi:7-cyano-7-deazaguanine synthase in queuosine biosynthesis
MFDKILLPFNLFIEVPADKSNIGINFSGGADSSLLLYILMKKLCQKIYIFTYVSNLKGRSTAKISVDVIEKCIQLTGNSNIEHYVSYHDTLNNETFIKFSNKYLSSGEISNIYTGVTSAPPKHINCNFSYSDIINERDADFVRRTYIKEYHWHMPFTNIDKSVIKNLYDYFEITDTLFPVTRSCEILNRSNYLNHCGECWWCNERKWAFDRL